jgi:hypothetical protein
MSELGARPTFNPVAHQHHAQAVADMRRTVEIEEWTHDLGGLQDQAAKRTPAWKLLPVIIFVAAIEAASAYLLMGVLDVGSWERPWLAAGLSFGLVVATMLVVRSSPHGGEDGR